MDDEKRPIVKWSIILSLGILIISTVNLSFRVYPYIFQFLRFALILNGIVFSIITILVLFSSFLKKWKAVSFIIFALISYYSLSIYYKYEHGIHAKRFNVFDLIILIIATAFLIYLFAIERNKKETYQKFYSFLIMPWVIVLVYISYTHFLTLNNFYTTYYFREKPSYLYFKSNELYYDGDLDASEKCVVESIELYKKFLYDENGVIKKGNESKEIYYGAAIQLLGSINREKGNYSDAARLYSKAYQTYIKTDDVLKEMYIEQLKEQLKKMPAKYKKE